MLKLIISFTLLSLISFWQTAFASKHAEEIIKLNVGTILPHNTITINLDKLNPEKNYEIGCYLSSDNLSGNPYDEIYISSPANFPYFKIDDVQLNENGHYYLPTSKESYLFAFTNKNLPEITIKNQSEKDSVIVSRCYAINYKYGPRH